MTTTLQKALELLSGSVNLSTGLLHSSDMGKTMELFLKLHQSGEILIAHEISGWASSNGWKDEYADALGTLAQQIGTGKKVVIQNGPYWNDQIIEDLKTKEET